MSLREHSTQISMRGPTEFISLSILLIAAHLLSACGCDDDKKKEDPNRPPAPLQEKSVPSDIEAEVYPQIGSTTPRPIALVLAKDPAYCSVVREEWKKSGHVLCVDAQLEVARVRFKKAITYLKKAYPRHTGSPPVHLFVDPVHAEAGWKLMLEEPGFFSYGFLAGLQEKVLTNVTLSALHTKGARELVLTLGESKRLKFLANVASRRGLQVRALGDKPGTLRQAVALMKSRDARFNPPKKQAPPTKPGP